MTGRTRQRRQIRSGTLASQDILGRDAALGSRGARKEREAGTPRRRAPTPINADFPGEACPAGSRVRFAVAHGRWLEGKVSELRLRHAKVIVGEDRWEVPYPGVEVLERAPSECTLAEAAALADTLLDRHKRTGDLSADWTFGFDLAPARGGVCRAADREIRLSVPFVLRAPVAEIQNTILHEIAHAVVGPEHGHDAVWKAKAQEIGCSGSRGHAIQPQVAAWVGTCNGCGRQWQRQRLQRRVRQNAMCGICRQRLQWRRGEA